jgi:hypothetical protein
MDHRISRGIVFRFSKDFHIESKLKERSKGHHLFEGILKYAKAILGIISKILLV